jgi:hypothetical protein
MFSKDPFDRERHEPVRSVVEEILTSFAEMDTALISNLLPPTRHSSCGTP